MPADPRPRSQIIGTGGYAPERVLTNFDLEKMVDTSDQWIRERTGIRERRIARTDETTSDMALVAARRALEAAGLRAAPGRALEAAGLTPKDLDMIVVGTISGDMPMPACAAFLQRKLGIT